MNLKRTIYSLGLCAMIAGGAPQVFADSYYDRKVTLFELLPIEENDIVFLGNSITDGGEWNELFDMPNIKNRGIVSDTMDGVYRRLDQVLRGRPKRIFLLIGINDVSHGHSVDTLAARYQKLVDKILADSPQTELILQSVMPINNDFGRYKALRGREHVIPKFNKRIQQIAAERGLTYVDLWGALADPKSGKLKKKYTNDGLHLTGAGYKAWSKEIENYVRK